MNVGVNAAHAFVFHLREKLLCKTKFKHLLTSPYMADKLALLTKVAKLLVADYEVL